MNRSLFAPLRRATSARRVLALAMMCLLACSTPVPTISIVATPTTKAAGANSCVVLTVTGTTDGQAFNQYMTPLPTEAVSWQTSGTAADIADAGATLIDENGGGSGASISGNVSGSDVKVQLCTTSNAPGVATVTAQVVDSSENVAHAEVSVPFTAPMSGACDGGNCLLATTINFACTCENIDVAYW